MWLSGTIQALHAETRTEEVNGNKCSESRATRPGRQQGVEERRLDNHSYIQDVSPMPE